MTQGACICTQEARTSTQPQGEGQFHIHKLPSGKSMPVLVAWFATLIDVADMRSIRVDPALRELLLGENSTMTVLEHPAALALLDDLREVGGDGYGWACVASSLCYCSP